jgi:hypothetical protein
MAAKRKRWMDRALGGPLSQVALDEPVFILRTQDIFAQGVVRSSGKLPGALVSRSWARALCRDISGDVWPDPVDHFPTYSQSVARCSVIFPIFA